MTAKLILAAILLSLCSGAFGRQSSPDYVLVNGKIFTGDASHPYVQALAIRGERILAIGESGKIQAMAGPRTKRIDLGGRLVIPGFNDAHNHLWIHPANWIQLEIHGPDPSWSELKAAILKAPKGAGILAVIGPTVFFDTKVNRDSLDQLAPDRPVVLATFTYHAAILNSAALTKVGLRDGQPDPLGGRYEKSADGRLTGVLREYAARQLLRTLTDMTSDADALSELRDDFSEFAKLGITSIQEISSEIAPDHCAALLEKIPTPIRVRVIRSPGTTTKGRDTQEGRLLPNHPAPLITVSGTKWFLTECK